jgi:hypothetical protein
MRWLTWYLGVMLWTLGLTLSQRGTAGPVWVWVMYGVLWGLAGVVCLIAWVFNLVRGKLSPIGIRRPPATQPGAQPPKGA